MNAIDAPRTHITRLSLRTRTLTFSALSMAFRRAFFSAPMLTIACLTPPIRAIRFCTSLLHFEQFCFVEPWGGDDPCDGGPSFGKCSGLVDDQGVDLFHMLERLGILDEHAVAGAAAGHGVLFAAGLITGEAMIGILMAIPIYLTKNPDVFALGFEVPSVVALLIVAAVAALLYRSAIGGSHA